MNRLTEKLITLTLCALILTGCGAANDTSNDAVGTDEAAVVETAEAATVAETISPYEPEVGDHDFGGATFDMFTRDNLQNCRCAINTEEETGEVLNDAIYNRNRTLEERYNFTFTELIGEYTVARTVLLSGEDAYDVIHTRCMYAFEYVMEDLLLPLDELSYIDLDKEYWDKESTAALSFMNKHYFAIGSYNLTTYDFIHLMLFNKVLAENNGIEDLYATVRDGEWTFDKFVEVAKPITSDVNGDGVMDVNDSYGYQAGSKQVLPNFWIAADELSIDFDSNDLPVFNMGSDERFFNVIDKIYNMLYDNNIWMPNQSTSNIPDECVASFTNGLSLFIDSTCFFVENLRAMETDFGILPYPKWDETQDEYKVRTEHGEFPCIPKANSDLDMTGIVLEVLSAESEKEVIPAYYDLSLQGKITRDEDSIEMLDLIFNSRVFDWGDTVFCDQVRDGALATMFRANDRDLASKIAGMETLVNTKIAAAVENVSK